MIVIPPLFVAVALNFYISLVIILSGCLVLELYSQLYGKEDFLDINNAINIYNYHVYINKISGVENFTINQLISEILNEKFKALNDYSIIPYTTTSVLGKDFYNIFI